MRPKQDPAGEKLLLPVEGLEKIAPGVKGIEGVEFFFQSGDAVTSFSRVTHKLAINGAALEISKKVLDGGREGHEKRHGTDAEKQARWNEYQTFIDKQYILHRFLSYAYFVKMAADHFHVDQKTIRRHTRKPQ